MPVKIKKVDVYIEDLYCEKCNKIIKLKGSQIELNKPLYTHDCVMRVRILQNIRLPKGCL